MTTSTSSGSGQHGDGGGRGVDASARLGDRHALHAMHAAFEFQLGIDTGADHFQGCVLDSAEIAFAHRHQFGAPALKLTITLIHPEQIGGEQRRFVAARAGANFDDGRGIVGRILRQKLQLQFALETFELGL